MYATHQKAAKFHETTGFTPNNSGSEQIFIKKTEENKEVQRSTELHHRKHKLAVLKSLGKYTKLKGYPTEVPVAQVVHPIGSSTFDVLSRPTSEHALETGAEIPAVDTANENAYEENPNVLAERIRQLINLSPAVIPTLNSCECASDPFPIYNAFGCAALPTSVIQIHDKRFIELLSNPTVMNGDKKKEWPTVWTVLDSLSPPNVDQEESRSGSSGIDSNLKHGSSSTSTLQASQNASSVMLYLPVQPTGNDEVELAESMFILVVTASFLPGLRPLAAVNVVHVTAGWKWWPFHCKKKGRTCEPRKISPITLGAPNSSTPSLPNLPKTTRKVWLPSRTKLSIEVTWWGYRIFLPPPVMTVLNNDEVTIVKRATIISTALTWLIEHIPLTVLPPPLQPVLLLLQNIVPYISYIGTFISWSWETVKGYDTGYGVILNATWLLPVALIPITWKIDSLPGATPTKGCSNRPIATFTNPETDTTSFDVAGDSAPFTMQYMVHTDDSSSQLEEPSFRFQVTPTGRDHETPVKTSTCIQGGDSKFVEVLHENREIIATLSPVITARGSAPLNAFVALDIPFLTTNLEPVEEGLEEGAA